MVYQEKTKFVIMLCKLYEDNTQKCDKYYPDAKTKKKKETYGSITVSLIETKPQPAEETTWNVLSVEPKCANYRKKKKLKWAKIAEASPHSKCTTCKCPIGPISWPLWMRSQCSTSTNGSRRPTQRGPPFWCTARLESAGLPLSLVRREMSIDEVQLLQASTTRL